MVLEEMTAANEVLQIGSVGEESLQERFLRFRKERQRERALTKRCAQAKVQGERDVETLRRKFVDACLSYLGVPYGKKFHEPDDPDYNAPLFLDCCGLVRRAVKDLQEDFGFAIGRSNQAYQFETLPQELTLEQMRPGDLIFVQGKYYSETKIQQRHFIVHVEVFLGGETGESTLGSRWSRSDASEGKVRGVQIHPSFKYVSKNYETRKYHFRSLDTWLNGICKSQTYSDAIYPTISPGGKKSVFDGSEEADEDAEADEAEFAPNPYRESPVFYVVDGNNWKALAQVLEVRGWKRLPFEAAYSHRFDLKWVETRGQLDYGRHIEGQLVNHIPNNDVITAKTKLVATLRAHQAATGESFSWAPSSYVSERPSERLAALAEAQANPDGIWILKPSRGLGGKGIEFVRGSAALRERLFPSNEADVSGLYPLEGWVVQRYIERPLLLQGRKFDIRAYCLVARTEPHLWFFHPGYCKVALDPYDLSQDLNDDRARYSHLTNACVQRTHPDYRNFRGQHIWSEAEAEAELIGSGRRQESDGPFWPRLHDDMKKIAAHLFRASKHLLERRRGYFDLLGLDFLVDEEGALHLLEANSNPAMFFDSSPTLEELVPRLLGTAIDVVLASQKPECAPAVVPPAPYELLVDEASGFCYGT